MHRTILLRRAAAGLAVGGGALLGSRLRLHEREVAPPPVPVRSWLRPLTASCEAAAPDGSPDLPVFTKAEVAKHTGGESGVWVSLGNKVYDITDFIANHPGGMEKIRLAAGGSLEPYWSLYRQHVDHTAADGGLMPKEHVAELLASMHIGWLDPADVASDKKTRSADDPYANEPARHPALVSVSDVPCSAELPREFIMDDWLTPAPLWFVRNHHPVPHLNEADFKLKVHGKGIGQKEYTLDQLKQGFGKTEVAHLTPRLSIAAINPQPPSMSDLPPLPFGTPRYSTSSSISDSRPISPQPPSILDTPPLKSLLFRASGRFLFLG